MSSLPSPSPHPLFAWLLSTVILTSCTIPGSGSKIEAQKLAGLMDRRLAWMDEVAAVKQARSLPVNDPAREAELLHAMEQRGAAAGLSPFAVGAFFSGQITAAKQLQKEWLHQHPHPSHSRLPDLAKTVRPALDEIGAEMILCLARLRASGADAPTVKGIAERHLTRAGYSQAVIRPAVAGLGSALKR